MANPEHLKILMKALEKEDIEIWNRWRRENWTVVPDLRDIQLYESDLSRILLFKANLTNINFINVDLTNADLRNVILDKANLHTSNLHAANLSGATLNDATLTGINATYAQFVKIKSRYLNLGGANLLKTDFGHASLVDANLDQAELYKAYLFQAELYKSNITNANLYGSTLRGANLRHSRLSYSDLSFVDFSYSKLHRVYIENCKLVKTNLSNAHIGFSNFIKVNLASCIGLETVHHTSPSTIGIDTLYQSGGNIPREFLEGCGVPEPMITFAKSLVGQAIEFYSCFISYSSKDEEFCKQLVERMKSAGLRVWFAPEEMKGGRKIYDQIDDAIRIYDKLIVVLSEHSMNSAWVRRELINARKREKAEGRQMLFPVSLVNFEALQAWQLIVSDGEDLAEEIRLYYIPDFSNWKDHDSFSREFDRLVADLRQGE